MLQIYPWVRGGQIECMGWHAQQRLRTQEGENMQRPNPGRQNTQVRRLRPPHLRPLVVYRRGRQFATYPQNSYTTEHPQPQVNHECIPRIPLNFHHPHWEDLQPPWYRSRADEGRCLLEDHKSPRNRCRSWWPPSSTFKKTLKPVFFLELGTSVLMIRDSYHSLKFVVPYKLRTRYLHQAHGDTKTLKIPHLHPLSSRITSHRTPYRTIYPHNHHKMKQNECL